MSFLLKALVESAGDSMLAKVGTPFSVSSTTDLAAHAAATSPLNGRDDPSDDQKHAGNYKKGHVRISGLHLAIENPEGSTRYSKADADPQWESTIKDAHYGYLKGTVGQDKEHLDVFLKPSTPADFNGDVYVVHQEDADGGFDEHKVMLGYANEKEATAAYSANYPSGWKVGEVKTMTMPEFKKWIASGSVVQRLFGSARAVAFAQPEPFLSKDVTTGTGLMTPQAGLTHYDRRPLAKPLIESDDDKAFSENVKAEIAAGKSQEQAVAIAYSVQREAKKKKGAAGKTDEEVDLEKGGPGSGRHPSLGSSSMEGRAKAHERLARIEQRNAAEHRAGGAPKTAAKHAEAAVAHTHAVAAYRSGHPDAEKMGDKAIAMSSRIAPRPSF